PATAKPSGSPQSFVPPKASPGVTNDAPLPSAAISPKPDRESDAIPPSPAHPTTSSTVGSALVEPGPERQAAVHPSPEFVVAKQTPAPMKPKPSTGQDTPGPAVLPAEQLRSPGPAEPISLEEIVRGLAAVTEPERKQAMKLESMMESTPPPTPS